MDVKSKKPAMGVGDLFSAMLGNPDVVSGVFAKLTPEQLAQAANRHPELLARAVGFLTPEVLGRLIQTNPDLLAASIRRVDAQVLARFLKEDPERMAAVLRCMDAECLSALWKPAGLRVLLRAVVSSPWLLVGTLVIGGLSLCGLARLVGVG